MLIHRSSDRNFLNFNIAYSFPMYLRNNRYFTLLIVYYFFA